MQHVGATRRSRRSARSRVGGKPRPRQHKPAARSLEIDGRCHPRPVSLANPLTGQGEGTNGDSCWLVQRSMEPIGFALVGRTAMDEPDRNDGTTCRSASRLASPRNNEDRAPDRARWTHSGDRRRDDRRLQLRPVIEIAILTMDCDGANRPHELPRDPQAPAEVAAALGIAPWLESVALAWESLEQQRLIRKYLRGKETNQRPFPVVLMN